MVCTDACAEGTVTSDRYSSQKRMLLAGVDNVGAFIIS